MQYEYSVPELWYDGLYKDKTPCCSAARPFSLLHDCKTDECWLLIHGYRGYPGELVRPAEDLYEAGFDVYVPRLPGHGTSGGDLIRSRSSDWTGAARAALADLKTRYKKVNILGHSMGTAIAALIGCGDSGAGKLVYASPSFENRQMSFFARAVLRVLSPFTPKVKCGWHASSKYHLHYENAPCDEQYLGREYWQYYFTGRLLEYYRLMKLALRTVKETPHEHLVVYPMLDKVISEPSVRLYKAAVGERANIAEVPNGTHSVFYDKDPEAEEAAVRAIVAFALS